MPAPGEPLFQAAAANLNPWTGAKVDTKNPERGPMLIISGELDHTLPGAISSASYKREKRNDRVTEIVKMPNRGHALTVDGGWREVADTALAFDPRAFRRPPGPRVATAGAHPLAAVRDYHRRIPARRGLAPAGRARRTRTWPAEAAPPT